MNLQVRVKEARNLLAADSNGLSDPYVNIQLGSRKQKTSVVCESLNPVWNNDFDFTVGDLEEELVLTIWDKDQFTDDFLGRVKIPVCAVLDADDQNLPLKWYPLQKRHSKSKTPVSGEILLSVCLYRKRDSPLVSIREETNEQTLQSAIGSTSSEFSENSSSKQTEHFSVNRNVVTDLSDEHHSISDHEYGQHAVMECALKTTGLAGSKHASATHDLFSNEDRTENCQTSTAELPSFLPGGILLDKKYAISPRVLNATLFKPECPFYQDLFTLQNTTNVEESPWEKSEAFLLHRTVRYKKAATRLVKAIDVGEDQYYIRADRDCYAVIEVISTLDVPYGNCFQTELLFVMVPQQGLALGEVATHLTISWRINFLENTWMKAVIEKKAKQGLEENFQQFAEVLTKYAQPIEDCKNQSELEVAKPISEWKLAYNYFGNILMLCTLTLLVFVLIHACMKKKGSMEGLEFWFLDLPDSLTEILLTAVVILLVERLVKRVHHFFCSRFWQGGDHGVKAVGDGWLVSIALVEGVCLAPAGSARSSDPYVVLKCNGKTRTSSVKMQTLNPHWQEIFEFDATEDLPSTMEAEVFDFKGLFVEPVSLGCAEINFLKYSADEMTDIWIPLDGRRARLLGSRIHLRLFLKNTKDCDITTQYIAKIERESGTKILKHSFERNISFQKLFSLPSQEFLVDDFTCALKRKVPIQGRLFLSPRMLGFYSNLFGRKTKFSFLWEDLEEINQESPVRAMGNLFNPSLSICVKKGRGNVPRQYAKKKDSKGRMHFQFQSFIKYGSACRLTTALWKARSLTPEERLQRIVAQDNRDGKLVLDSTFLDSRQEDDFETFLSLEEASMTEVLFTKFRFNVESMLMLYTNQKMDSKVMEKTGLLNYMATPWDTLNKRPSVQQREQNFKLSGRLSKYSSDITCLQQKTVLENKRSCIIDELLTFQDVPLGDNFQLQIRKEIEDFPGDPTSCTCRIFLGIAWRKSSMLQKRVTGNILEEFTKLLKEQANLAELVIFEAKGKL